jgi:hypothetical protein
MKKTLVVASILAAAAGAYAQGVLDWNDEQNGYIISIISPNPANPTVEQTGNTSFDIPAGGASYGGGWIGGTATAPGGGVGATPSSGVLGINFQMNGNFETGLYVATTPTALTAAIETGTPLATTGIQGGVNAGLYTSTMLAATDPSVAAGLPVYVGIAAWYSGGGAGSYAAAVNAVDPAGYVESTVPVTLGTSGSPTGLAGLGLTSFSLVVPEPGTVALGVVGASVFLMRLRRKQ